ncbi:MAG TPA: hypothetical protein VMH37_17485 [Candidatus Binataceae bacterium]|nr:hypothetical protein [Candidatus Binataceae bacterium]
MANILSLTSGFALMGYRLPPLTILMTSIVVDLALAPLTAVIASRRGRSGMRWTIAGLALGMWALAVVLVLPAANQPRPDQPYPPTSDAA